MYLIRHLRVRVAGAGLDARLARGDDPASDPLLACRAGQLVSRRSRRGLARGIARVLAERAERSALSSAISCNWEAVEIARPALEQLATALVARERVLPRGIALTRVLLTEPFSALYRPARPDELYEVAREALLSLLPVSEPAAERVRQRGQVRAQRATGAALRIAGRLSSLW